MKMIYIILSSMILALTSCDEKDCCSGIPGDDTLFEFSLLDESGTDLLDPEIQGTYNTDNIRLYNEENGDTTMVYDENSDTPYGYTIIERESVFRIRPFFLNADSEFETIGYIKWNSEEIDTLKLELVQQSENIKRLTKIHYNGIEVWNEETTSNSEDRYFQIIK